MKKSKEKNKPYVKFKNGLSIKSNKPILVSSVNGKAHIVNCEGLYLIMDHKLWEHLQYNTKQGPCEDVLELIIHQKTK